MFKYAMNRVTEMFDNPNLPSEYVQVLYYMYFALYVINISKFCIDRIHDIVNMVYS